MKKKKKKNGFIQLRTYFENLASLALVSFLSVAAIGQQGRVWPLSQKRNPSSKIKKDQGPYSQHFSFFVTYE